MTSDDKVAILARALQTIADDAAIDGFWTDCLSGDVMEGSHAAGAPHGYYDSEHPPAGYDADGWIGEHGVPVPERIARAVFWTPCTPDDLLGWLQSCAWVARQALAQVATARVAVNADRPTLAAASGRAATSG